jgi:hypothetical protein
LFRCLTITKNGNSIKSVSKNTVITYIGFGIGAINTIYLYPFFLGATYCINNYILSASIVMPLFAFGMQNSLVKFFSQCKTDRGGSGFTLQFYCRFYCRFLYCWLGCIFWWYLIYLSQKTNSEGVLWLIPFTGLCMAYFEIFYAWESPCILFLVILLKKLFYALFIIALIGVYFKWITVIEFVYVTAGIYFLAFIVTMLYAFILKPEFNSQFPIIKRLWCILFLLFYPS